MQPNKSRPELVVGIFGVIALFIIVYMSREVTDTPFRAKEGATYYAYFDSVSGLIPKTPVEVAGIQVGFIDEIGLDNQRARLVLSIDPEIAIYEDARAVIVSRGILGDKILSIRPGTTGKRRLQDGDTFGGSGQGGDFEAIFSTLEETANNVNELAAILKNFVKREVEGGNLTAIVDNMAAMTEKLNLFIEGNTGTMSEVLANLRDVTASLKGLVDSDVDDKLVSASISLENTLGTLERLVGGIERGEGTIGKLVKDEATITSLNNAIKGVEKLTSGANRLQTEVRYRGEYLTDSEDLQNLVSLTIRPRPDKFFRFELVDTATGDTNVTQTTVANSDGTVLSSTETTETDDKVLFSFELAKRFYDATFRFGIIRNEGGIGLDYAFFDDMLTLSLEAFNFSRLNDNFQFRSYATLYLWEYLMLTAGADDILSDNDRVDPFVGAGITFRDDDIRTLFGALSLSSF